MMKRLTLIVVLCVGCLCFLIGATSKIGHAIHHDYVTGTGTIDFNMANARNLEIMELRIHLSAASDVTGLTLVVNSGLAAAYDTNVFSPPSTETSRTDVVWRPGNELILTSTDSLDLDLTLAGGTTYGVVILWKER